MKRVLTLAAAAALALAPATAIAEGNLAAEPTTLELFIDGRNLTFSNTEYQIETGKYYRWEMTSDGIEEVMIRAPDLFRNSWINQIIINDLEVHTSGAIYGIEFDDEGTVVLFFVPIRPGNYEFFVPGFEERGLSGTFVVR
jgi:hypothetical protein